jgi:hypothetical protein
VEYMFQKSTLCRILLSPQDIYEDTTPNVYWNRRGVPLKYNFDWMRDSGCVLDKLREYCGTWTRGILVDCEVSFYISGYDFIQLASTKELLRNVGPTVIARNRILDL